MDKELGENLKDVIRSQTTCHLDGQALPREFVNHGQHAKRPSVMGPRLDEVVGPDMVPPVGSEPDTGPVVKPEPVSLGLLGRDLEPLAPPDAFYPLVVHMPAFGSQQGRDAPIAVTAILARQVDDRGRQRLLVWSRYGLVSL